MMLKMITATGERTLPGGPGDGMTLAGGGGTGGGASVIG
jgi:hypothetical protein